MYTVTCPASGLSVVVACACDQVGHDPAAAGAHHDRCQMSNLTANLTCPPSAGCCAEDHDHEATANACPGAHDGQECPAGTDCLVFTPAGEDCPGGHCHKDVDGCTVCHPVIITAGMGAAVLRPAVSA
jgi:hypothetical protein